jgi:hypothetical protein
VRPRCRASGEPPRNTSRPCLASCASRRAARARRARAPRRGDRGESAAVRGVRPACFAVLGGAREQLEQAHTERMGQRVELSEPRGTAWAARRAAGTPFASALTLCPRHCSIIVEQLRRTQPGAPERSPLTLISMEPR